MTSLTPKILKNILESVPKLQKLYLMDCSPANQFLDTIHACSPKLELLSIMKTPILMFQINKLSNLRTLVFSYYGVAPEGYKYGRNLHEDENLRINLPNLTDLSIELATGSVVPTFQLPKLQVNLPCSDFTCPVSGCISILL